ncbi:MAG: four helix bundle protein [Candidatus Marinimicrobia bacterium]|nr:four helix bundle protein [Candidatus Neomarinimicrobiota bacterium]
MNNKTEELLERTFRFGVNILQFLNTVPRNDILRVPVHQLAKSGTSIGANYEEAQAAESKKDFAHKIGIVLKEVRESNYWLRIFCELVTDKDLRREIQQLENESIELRKIFSTIRKSSTK